MATFKDTPYYAQRNALRAQKDAAVNAALAAQSVAVSSTSPDANLIEAQHWYKAAEAALGIDALAKQSKANSNYFTPDWSAVIDEPMGATGNPPAKKKAKERAFYYNQYAGWAKYAAEQKGAPAQPPAPKPITLDPGMFEAIYGNKPVAKPTGRPDPVLGDSVTVDPATGVQLNPETGEPVEPGLSTGAKLGIIGVLTGFGLWLSGKWRI